MTIHPSSHRRTRRVHVDTQTDADSDHANTESDRLAQLAGSVEAALAADHDHPPTLIAAVDHGASVEILLDPLDHHPADELEGFVAPSSWWCLGVAAGGHARTLDDSPEHLLGPAPHRYPIHLTHLVSRSGLVARVLRDRRTDAVLTHASVSDRTEPDQADGGLIDDYLRRSLGVATPPPARDTTELFAAIWIHRVMDEAVRHRLLAANWSRVARLHPAFDPDDRSLDPELGAWAAANLVQAGELVAEVHPWGRVRAACQLGIGPVAGRPAELAGWLDDGSFARATLACFAPLADLLVDLHELVRPEVHARLITTVEAWALLDSPVSASAFEEEHE